MDRRNLKVFRVRHGLTQCQMALKIGVSRSIYAEVEKGTRNCSQTFLEKLQKAFNIPDEDMWTLTKIYNDNESEE